MLLDPRQGGRVLLQLRRADPKAPGRNHAAGKLLEALFEHTLSAIAPQDPGIECHSGQARIDGCRRDALRNCLLADVVQPFLEPGRVTASEGLSLRRNQKPRQDR